MQFVPCPAQLRAMFRLQPLARSLNQQAGSVDQHMQRTVWHGRRPDHRPLYRPTIDRGVIGRRYRQVGRLSIPARSTASIGAASPGPMRPRKDQLRQQLPCRWLPRGRDSIGQTCPGDSRFLQDTILIVNIFDCSLPVMYDEQVRTSRAPTDTQLRTRDGLSLLTPVGGELLI
jgi:hypothetical protein